MMVIYGTSSIVSEIGITNVYGIAFIVAAIASASIVTSASYYGFVIALTSNSGVNPYLLSIVLGAGMTVGDIFFFKLGKETRLLLPKKVRKHVDKLITWIIAKNNRYLATLTFLWAAFLPLPNDVITISTGVASTNWRYVIPSMFFGNILFIYLFTYFITPLFS